MTQGLVTSPLPEYLEDRVSAISRNGNVPREMALQKESWFYSYLQSGDATKSARECGLGGSNPSWKGHHLVKQFYPLIVEAVQVRRAAIEPLALKVLEDTLKTDHMVPLILRDSDGNQTVTETMVADAKILGVKVKAADSVLDRGLMPKGLALHGTVPGAGDGEKQSDWKAHLDELVVRLGVDVVVSLPLVKQRPDMQGYLSRQYPAKVVNEVPQEAMEATDGGPLESA